MFANSYLPPKDSTSTRPPQAPLKRAEKVAVNISGLSNPSSELDMEIEEMNDEGMTGDVMGSKHKSVVIAEHMNKTVDITPRPQRIQSAGSIRGHPNRPSSASSDKGSPGKDSKKDQNKVPVPTVSVAYVVQEDNDNQQKQTKQKKKQKKFEEPESMMSQLNLNGLSDTPIVEIDRSTKQVSSGKKNYYEQSQGTMTTPVMKTIKTLELADGNLMEKKSFSMLDQHTPANKDTVKPPRPVSAKKIDKCVTFEGSQDTQRPKSATKSISTHSAAVNSSASETGSSDVTGSSSGTGSSTTGSPSTTTVTESSSSTSQDTSSMHPRSANSSVSAQRSQSGSTSNGSVFTNSLRSCSGSTQKLENGSTSNVQRPTGEGVSRPVAQKPPSGIASSILRSPGAQRPQNVTRSIGIVL